MYKSLCKILLSDNILAIINYTHAKGLQTQINRCGGLMNKHIDQIVPRRLQSHRIQLMIAVIATIALFAMFPGVGMAAAEPAELEDAQPVVVTIPANGTADLPIYGYCLDRGRPFPGSTLVPVDLTAPNVRVGISYSVDQGYIQASLFQTQLAIWDLNRR